MTTRSGTASIEGLTLRSSAPGRTAGLAVSLSGSGSMKELLRSNDPVRLSWAEALLAAAGIESVIADRHTSIIEGSIGAIPRRILVADEDLARARRLLAEAEGA